jgi:hypothetical protein
LRFLLRRKDEKAAAMAGRANIPTNSSALIAIIADEVAHWHPSFRRDVFLFDPTMLCYQIAEEKNLYDTSSLLEIRSRKLER